MTARSGSSTRFPVGLEEGEDGFTIVHSLTLPGCSSEGGSVDEALAAFPAALGEWLGLLESLGEEIPDRDTELDVVVVEWIRADGSLAGRESTVCFQADHRPLTDEEIFRGLHLLGALRGNLLPLIRRERDEDLAALGDADWNVRIVLEELARAQWWTLTRLGASPLAEVPGSTVARLDTAMALVVRQLTELGPDERDRVVLIDGEEWTPRKVLRRQLWLEWTLGGAALDSLRTPGAFT
jgi:predicted RNase H-like HicB family nuclease